MAGEGLIPKRLDWGMPYSNMPRVNPDEECWLRDPETGEGIVWYSQLNAERFSETWRGGRHRYEVVSGDGVYIDDSCSLTHLEPGSTIVTDDGRTFSFAGNLGLLRTVVR